MNIRNMNSGIYKIQNKINLKVYIGSSLDLKKRKGSHFRELRRKDHKNQKLQRAFNKYGESIFFFEVIEFCNPEILIEREQHWMDQYDVIKNGYNISPYAGSTLGMKCTDETKEKIGKANKGRRISLETRNKISIANKGRKLSDKHKGKIGLSKVGKVRSEETKKKISLFMKNDEGRRGEGGPYAKLKWEQVWGIRRLWGQKIPYRKIAQIFGLSFGTVYSIVSNKTWKDNPMRISA